MYVTELMSVCVCIIYDMFAYESEIAPAYNFNYLFEDEEHLKVTVSPVHYKCGSVSERCRMESLLLQTTNRK